MSNEPDEKEMPNQSNENMVLKYKLLREKIIKNYTKGCKILNISKIIVAILFILFTVIGITVSNKTGNKMFWLILWIILIFTNIGIFIITDYCKYLVKSKVIPYLEDDNQIEFGEYTIFLEDEDEEDEEDDE